MKTNTGPSAEDKTLREFERLLFARTEAQRRYYVVMRHMSWLLRGVIVALTLTFADALADFPGDKLLSAGSGILLCLYCWCVVRWTQKNCRAT